MFGKAAPPAPRPLKCIVCGDTKPVKFTAVLQDTSGVVRFDRGGVSADLCAVCVRTAVATFAALSKLHRGAS